MDKAEYQIKLDEINRLVDLQEYEDALEIIDTIEDSHNLAPHEQMEEKDIKKIFS